MVYGELLIVVEELVFFCRYLSRVYDVEDVVEDIEPWSCVPVIFLYQYYSLNLGHLQPIGDDVSDTDGLVRGHLHSGGAGLSA